MSADWELEWDQGGLVIFAGTPPGQMAARQAQQAAAAATAMAATTTSPRPPTTTTSTTTIEVPNIADILLEDDDATQRPATSSLPQTSIASNLGNVEPPSPNPPGTGPQPVVVDSRGPPPAYPTVQQPPASKWVKVGLEFCNNACHATSVVANSDGADWSLSALPAHQQRRYDLRVKIERIGYALWVWYEDDLVGWKKLREVTWFFWGVEDKAVRVGVYASRPANFGLSMFDARRAANGEAGDDRRFQARNLCVDFEGLEIF